MDFSSICRTCLGTKYLNPIFKDEDDHSRYSTAVFITIGLKVELNDGLPQQMCQNCMKLLNDSLKFRKQCKDTEIQLLDIKNSSKSHVLKKYKNTEQISKRKRSKDDYIKIENGYSENDEIPLKNLLKCNAKDQNVKIETQYIKIGLENEHETDTNDFIKNLIKTDLDININIKEPITHPDNATHELKYEEEYLDEQLESHSESRHHIVTYIKDTATISEDSFSDVTKTDMPFIIRDSNRVICKLCQKDLSKRSIDSHMTKRHPGADKRRTKCELCDTYVFKQRLNRHRILMHGRDCFRCGYCKAEFDSKEVLLNHVPTCTAKKRKRRPTDKRKEQKVECDVCHKMMQKASLRMHKEVKHAGMGPVCEHCGRRFGNKFRLNEHLRAKHDYEKFKCSLCDFLSASSMAMRNHERRHRGERPFACTSCSARFHAPHLLSQHKQSHRTEKLMKCNLCPAAFKTNNTLHMHKITCHNAHVYQCSMCPRTYSCRHYAVKHLRNVHRHTGPVGSLQRSPKLKGGGEVSRLDLSEDEELPGIVALVQRLEGVS